MKSFQVEFLQVHSLHIDFRHKQPTLFREPENYQTQKKSYPISIFCEKFINARIIAICSSRCSWNVQSIVYLWKLQPFNFNHSFSIRQEMYFQYDFMLLELNALILQLSVAPNSWSQMLTTNYY
jgi:hypothetical protein